MNNLKDKFRNAMGRFSNRMYNFMVGRYGMDDLYKFLLYFSIFCVVLNLFVRSKILYYLGLASLVFATFRAYSKNIAARRRENDKYLALTKDIRPFVKLQVRRIREIKTARFRRCPHCHKTLRLPNRKGRHTVVCPNCHQEFKVTIRI